MKFVGVDLHKQVIALCVTRIAQEPDGPPRREVVARRRFQCSETQAIREFVEKLAPFQVVVEATAAYEWFFLLIDDLADRVVLRIPKSSGSSPRAPERPTKSTRRCWPISWRWT